MDRLDDHDHRTDPQLGGESRRGGQVESVVADADGQSDRQGHQGDGATDAHADGHTGEHGDPAQVGHGRLLVLEVPGAVHDVPTVRDHDADGHQRRRGAERGERNHDGLRVHDPPSARAGHCMRSDSVP